MEYLSSKRLSTVPLSTVGRWSLHPRRIPEEMLEPTRLRSPKGFRELLAAFAAASPRSREEAMRIIVHQAYSGMEVVSVNDGALLAPAGVLGGPFLHAAASGASATPFDRFTRLSRPRRIPAGNPNSSAAGSGDKGGGGTSSGVPDTPDAVVVDFLLHGTHVSNVAPILRESVVSMRPCGRCWFTREVMTAAWYGSGDAVLCAVLLRPEHLRESIVTTAAKEHHLPLAHVKLRWVVEERD